MIQHILSFLGGCLIGSIIVSSSIVITKTFDLPDWVALLLMVVGGAIAIGAICILFKE